MGEIEGTYRALQTPGTRLGAQFNAGISTLEPGQSLSVAMGAGGKGHGGRGGGLQLRVLNLDDTQEFYDLEVSVCVRACVVLGLINKLHVVAMCVTCLVLRQAVCVCELFSMCMCPLCSIHACVCSLVLLQAV